MSVLSYFRIKPKRGKQILSEVKTAVSGWRRSAKKVGMTDAEIEQFADAFEFAEA